MRENDYRIKAFVKKTNIGEIKQKGKYWCNQIEGKILVKSNRREIFVKRLQIEIKRETSVKVFTNGIEKGIFMQGIKKS